MVLCLILANQLYNKFIYVYLGLVAFDEVSLLFLLIIFLVAQAYCVSQ